MRLHFFNSAVIATSKMDNWPFEVKHDDWSMLLYLIATWDSLGTLSLLLLATTKLRRKLGQNDPIIQLDTRPTQSAELSVIGT